MVTLPYGAWGAELATLYHQRSRVTASREGFVLVGLFVAALAPAVVQAMGKRYAAGDTDGAFMQAMIWLVGKDGQLGLGYGPILDRKSTRLNSSHVRTSYAVFCLKK